MLTLANLLTIARMVLIPLLITLLLSNHHGWAFAVFVIAGLTDALDGIIARRYKQSSGLGAFLDPMADKLLMTAGFIVLSLPDHPRAAPEFHIVNHIEIYLTIVTISRDVFIVLIVLLAHLTYGLTRFTPTLLGKITTVTQVIMIGSVLLLNYLGIEAPITVRALTWVTLAATLTSGFHYIYHATRIAGTETPASPERRPGAPEP
ncbi:MAG TPA: CDP-alcohol phosphatidyltransferase family protein [Candidatus Polarisedimenticolia bacterium]|nr:CDP-alcohol phosphatidyltransferase family protein [Candidatus Polarisedimenticolia bacterium]